MELEQGGDLLIADGTHEKLIVFIEVVEIEEMGSILSSPPNKAPQD
jgi:hypothetical protein